MEEKIYLENLLISLQKTFSRVNVATAENLELRPETPTARLSGDINFSINTKATPVVGDKLLITKDGHVDLTFQGVIDLDEEPEESNETSTGTVTDNPEEQN